MKALQLSYSKLNTYENCPRQFKAKYVTKTYPDEGDNQYFIHGHKIHKQLEQQVLFMQGKGEQVKLHSEAQSAIGIIQGVLDKFEEIYVEQKISVDVDFSIVPWFDRSTYYRAVMDLVAKRPGLAMLIDWKTGKVREYDDKPTGQLHLAAAMLLSTQQDVDKVVTAYCFVGHNHTIPKTFHRKDLNELIDPFHEAWHVIDEDEEFLPKKNSNCYFCAINPAECEFQRGG
jgi:CRISPR/Cas system-associated exonuclease Cas4 (RecB family)